MDELDADLGHTWRVTVEMRSSTIVSGEPHHHDAPGFTHLPKSVEVRGWSVHEAMQKASELPVSAWFEENLSSLDTQPYYGSSHRDHRSADDA